MSNEDLQRMYSGVASSSLATFKSWGGIPSGPGEELFLNFSHASIISCFVNLKSSSWPGALLSALKNSLGFGTDHADLVVTKKLLYCFLSVSAVKSASGFGLPVTVSMNGPILDLVCCSALAYAKNAFGFVFI